MAKLDGYKPEKVLYYFEKISSVPRNSLKEEKIADYLEEFAHRKKLEVNRDEYNNIVIKKKATLGYENCDTMILQGHSDMVCLSEEGYEHDFDKEGLDLYVEEGLIKARGTTLGADNGIALAYGLAVLDSEEIEHPNLEVVFTTAEEIGMVGAKNMDMSKLTGKNMISFDSGGFTEGRIYVGCAGGERFKLTQKIDFVKATLDSEVYEISIRGLKGGHAGGEISKGRANATLLIGRLLLELKKSIAYELVSIQGGDKATTIKHSIPERGNIIIKTEEKNKLEEIVASFEKMIIEEFGKVEDSIVIEIANKNETIEEVISSESLGKIIDTLIILPNGVLTMHKYFTDTPECSNNVGNLELIDKDLIYYISVRSSKDSLLDYVGEKLRVIADIYGYHMERDNRLSGWEYEPKSKLKDLIDEEYSAIYGEKPRFKITHASTECGLFKKQIKDLDVISIGPIIYEEHTVNEYMEINSINELWKFLCNILKRANEL